MTLLHPNTREIYRSARSYGRCMFQTIPANLCIYVAYAALAHTLYHCIIASQQLNYSIPSSAESYATAFDVQCLGKHRKTMRSAQSLYWVLVYLDAASVGHAELHACIP